MRDTRQDRRERRAAFGHDPDHAALGIRLVQGAQQRQLQAANRRCSRGSTARRSVRSCAARGRPAGRSRSSLWPAGGTLRATHLSAPANRKSRARPGLSPSRPRPSCRAALVPSSRARTSTSERRHPLLRWWTLPAASGSSLRALGAAAPREQPCCWRCRCGGSARAFERMPPASRGWLTDLGKEPGAGAKPAPRAQVVLVRRGRRCRTRGARPALLLAVLGVLLGVLLAAARWRRSLRARRRRGVGRERGCDQHQTKHRARNQLLHGFPPPDSVNNVFGRSLLSLLLTQRYPLRERCRHGTALQARSTRGGARTDGAGSRGAQNGCAAAGEIHSSS